MAFIGEGMTDEEFRANYGGTGQAGEREFLSGAVTNLNAQIEGQNINLGDAFRKAERTSAFMGLTPLERATAQARADLGLSPIGSQGTTANLSQLDLSGNNLAEIAQRTGIAQNQIIDYRRGQAGSNVVSDTGLTNGPEQESYGLRSALPASGTPQKANNYWDSQRGVNVNAPPGSYFELYPGGAVKLVKGTITGTPEHITSSLFTQPKVGNQPTQGFEKEELAIQPIEGKTIARTGQTIKNPETGVDVHAGQGNIMIEYDDGTVEERAVSNIQQPGEAKPIEEVGPTAEELGITRRTEIKGGPGPEVTRAPMSAAEALAAAQTPEEMDRIIQEEGLASTSTLEFIGTEYTDQKTGERRIAAEGNAF